MYAYYKVIYLSWVSVYGHTSLVSCNPLIQQTGMKMEQNKYGLIDFNIDKILEGMEQNEYGLTDFNIDKNFRRQHYIHTSVLEDN